MYWLHFNATNPIHSYATGYGHNHGTAPVRQELRTSVDLTSWLQTDPVESNEVISRAKTNLLTVISIPLYSLRAHGKGRTNGAQQGFLLWISFYAILVLLLGQIWRQHMHICLLIYIYIYIHTHIWSGLQNVLDRQKNSESIGCCCVIISAKILISDFAISSSVKPYLTQH